MVEACTYAIALSLCLIGIYTLLFFMLIHIFKANNDDFLIIKADSFSDTDKFCNLLWRIKIVNIFFNGILGNTVYFIDNNIDSKKKETINYFSDENFELIYIDLQSLFEMLGRKD